MFAMPTRISQESLWVCPLMKRLKALSEVPMASAGAACVGLRSRASVPVPPIAGVPGKYACVGSAFQRYRLTFISRMTGKILRRRLHFLQETQIRRFVRTRLGIHLSSSPMSAHQHLAIGEETCHAQKQAVFQASTAPAKGLGTQKGIIHSQPVEASARKGE